MRLCSLLALLFFGSLAQGQPAVEPKDGKVTIPLTLSPAPLPKPLSRFYLTPQYKEMQPGNRVPSYMKAYMEQAQFFSKDPAAEREKWNLMKLEELPLDKIKASGCVGGLAYRTERETALDKPGGPVTFRSMGRPLSDVDEGSRMLTADWQMWFQIRRDGIETLLPEVQKMRELAGVLKVRMRYEIATKDFEKAAYTARTYFGLVQSFETNPTLIAALVGLSIETVCLNAVEEMIQQPGCPNLHWSIAEIPADAVSLRIPIQGEKSLCETLFGILLHAKGELPEAEVKRIVAQIDTIVYLSNDGKKKTIPASDKYAAQAKDEKKVAAGRAYLIQTGMNAEMVNKLPPLQVIVTHDAQRYEADLDDYFRVIGLPNPEAEKLVKEMDAKWKGETDRMLSQALLPAANKVRQTQARLQQRVAYLRVIEALRLHAHENGGRLPAQLKDVKVPLPADPVTGEAFQYSVKDGVATLTGGNPNPGLESSNRVYEIRMRK